MVGLGPHCGTSLSHAELALAAVATLWNRSAVAIGMRQFSAHSGLSNLILKFLRTGHSRDRTGRKPTTGP